MDNHIQYRIDRIVVENLVLIEAYWSEALGQDMGRCYIEVVEVPRPDGLVAFAVRARPWAELPEPRAWDEATVVVVVRLIEGTAIRQIPRPVAD